MQEVPGLRTSYLDGCIELMTVGKKHKNISRLLVIFLALYFHEKGIKFIPVGSATCEDEAKEVSFQPDESYYIGTEKEYPDLAIEVVITSGGVGKLEKYKRLRITEVWFWENNQLVLYRLRGDNYEQISQSEFLPELDLELLGRCIQMSDTVNAMTEFLNGIRQ